jgi:hypothetical protein
LASKAATTAASATAATTTFASTIATTAAATTLGHEVDAGACRIRGTNRFVLVAMSNRIHTTLRAQVGVGARLEIVITAIAWRMVIALIARCEVVALAATATTRAVAVVATRAVARALVLTLFRTLAFTRLKRNRLAVFIQHAFTRL